MKDCPEERQTLLFSATMPKQIIQFSRAGLREPQLLRLDNESKLSEELRIAFFLIRSNEKLASLIYIVNTLIPDDQQTIIFTATKHHSELIHALFEKLHLKSTMVYGSMDQDARTSNLKSFRAKHSNFLIVTDVAARGIDIPMLHNVINYHFPPSPKLFIHRCGRAARQGRVGFSYSLVEPEEVGYMMDVHLFLDRPLSGGYKSSTTTSSTADDVSIVDSSGDVEIRNTVSCGPYTTQTMTPDMVHTGLLLQDSIDAENEYVKSTIEKDIVLVNQYRVCENAMKQYHRTRTEATREGIKAAKTMTKNKQIVSIHPLIAGSDTKRCSDEVVEKAAYVRALQSFRPAQTVLETGIGTGSSANQAKNAAKLKKKREAALLQNMLGNKSGISGNSKDLAGVEVMHELRKVMSQSLDRNRSNNSKNNSIVLPTEKTPDAVSIDAENDDVEIEGMMMDEFDEAYEEEIASTSASKVVSRKRKDTGSTDEFSATIVHDDCISTMGIASGVPKQRLSIAERKKQKKYGENYTPTPAPTSSSNDQRTIAVDESTSDAVVLRKEAAFKDKHYMAYGTENERESFTERSLQPQSQLRTSEAQNALQIEQALLGIVLCYI